MALPSTAHKLGAFVRSVLPADVGQAALLLGSVLLLATPHMGSWRPWLFASRENDLIPVPLVASLLQISLTAVYVAGVAALFVCFFPGARPSGRIAKWVYAPFVIGWFADFGIAWHFYSLRPEYFPSFAAGEHASSAEFHQGPGLGFWISLAAIALVIYADMRLRRKKMGLPVRLLVEPRADAAPVPTRFIWVMVALTTYFTSAASLPVALILMRVYGSAGSVSGIPLSDAMYGTNQIAWAISFFVLGCVAMGRDWKEALRRCFQFLPLKYVGLGILIPVALGGLAPFAQYVIARAKWAETGYGNEFIPLVRNHFPAFEAQYLLLILGALAEEIVWRGYLQPRFIRRYGLYRGIFLVGMVWAIFHFPFDFGTGTNAIAFLDQFAGRIVNCVAWGFVLSWLTLRARSVVPAGICHGLMNAFYTMGWTEKLSSWVIYFLWAMLAFALFRYWPLKVEDADPPSEFLDVELRGAQDVAPESA